jgi:hypothetical protein
VTNAAGLLAPVLEGVEAEVGEPGRVGVAIDAEDAAFFLGPVGPKAVFGFRFWVFGGIHGTMGRKERLPC